MCCIILRLCKVTLSIHTTYLTIDITGIRRNSLKHIHIIGMGPRTGSTLMQEVIRSFFNIDYSTAHEDRLFARPTTKCEIFLTKHPGDMFVIKPSLLVDPNLWVICLIRDPRDAIISRHNDDKSKYWAGLRYWKAFFPIYKTIESHPRFITVKFEDSVKNPNEIQQLLLRKIPFLTLHHLFSDYHLVSKVSEKSANALLGVRPISPIGIGGWKEDLPRINSQVQLHGEISQDLIYFGYEKDFNWESQISAVAAQDNDSHWPEFFDKKDLKKRKSKRWLEAARRIFAFFKAIPVNWPSKTQVKRV
jgi:hypothetical protein